MGLSKSGQYQYMLRSKPNLMPQKFERVCNLMKSIHKWRNNIVWTFLSCRIDSDRVI